MENQKKRLFYILVLMILCLVTFGIGGFLGYYFYYNKNKQAPANESVILHAMPIKAEDLVIKTSYVGHVEAIQQVSVVPYISGYLDNIAVIGGQNVKEGELLLSIEDSEYKAKLDAAEASVLKAEANLDYSKNYYERVQKSGRKAFSEIEINKAKNDYLQAEAGLKNAIANKKLAEVNLHYTKIMAPISGLVGNIDLSIGDYVAPSGEILLNIVQTNPIRVVFSLTDKEYLNLRDDNSPFKDSVIKLTLANGKVFKYTGQFKYSDNKFDTHTNSLAVYAYFQNDENELLPNAFVNIDIYKTFKDSVYINKSLINMKPDGYFLNVARNDKIIQQSVFILGEKNNGYVIKNTFLPNDLIITDKLGELPKKAKIIFNISKS